MRTKEQSDPSTSSPIGLDVDSEVLGVDVRSHQPDRPLVGVSYTRSESTNHVPLLPSATQSTQSLGVSTSHGAPGFSYGASYAGTFSEGTYVTDAFDNHRVNVFAKASVAEGLDLRLSDTYYLRVPTELSPFSPRQELNALNAVLIRRKGAADFEQVGYGYSRGIQTAIGTPDLDRSSHRLGYAVQRTLSNPEWRTRGSVDLTLGRNRVGAEEHQDAGQSLGLSVTWARTLRNGGYAGSVAAPASASSRGTGRTSSSATAQARAGRTAAPSAPRPTRRPTTSASPRTSATAGRRCGSRRRAPR